MEEITIKTDDIVTLTEAAKMLNVSRPTVYNFISRHQLHPVVFGRNRYLIRNEVETLKNNLSQ